MYRDLVVINHAMHCAFVNGADASHTKTYECSAVENGIFNETVRISLTRDEKSVWLYLFVSFLSMNTLV